jgi:4-diphosphocytidyl-2-C-methyl-D-erythritol kinase
MSVGTDSTPWWPAPAKLNLFLHVTGREPDGYHSLQTVFQLLDWCDELRIEATDDGRIERVAGPDAIAPDQDLAVRAARALQQASGVRRGARIAVRKRIPTGGGLGGGSSDAATVLLVLNRLWGLGLDLDALAAVGLTLGADVPVFVRGESAWGEGRGERLTPIRLPEQWFVVLHPGVSVSTAEVFQAPELTRNSPVLTIRAFSPGQIPGSGTRNDCEPVVRARVPAVGEALDWLARFAPSRMSGTGACVFAAFDSAAAAERVAARVPEGWSSRVARGVQRSPLHERLSASA